MQPIAVPVQAKKRVPASFAGIRPFRLTLLLSLSGQRLQAAAAVHSGAVVPGEGAGAAAVRAVVVRVVVGNLSETKFSNYIYIGKVIFFEFD